MLHLRLLLILQELLQQMGRDQYGQLQHNMLPKSNGQDLRMRMPSLGELSRAASHPGVTRPAKAPGNLLDLNQSGNLARVGSSWHSSAAAALESCSGQEPSGQSGIPRGASGPLITSPAPTLCTEPGPLRDQDPAALAPSEPSCRERRAAALEKYKQKRKVG